MTALTDLLAKVEAGAYDRGDGEPKLYTDFRNDCEAAGIRVEALPMMVSALHKGSAAVLIRDLIDYRALSAKEAGE